MLMSFWVVKLHVYLQCITICHFLISSLEPLHGFASNFVWMFLGWTPTKFVKIGVLPLFFMELWVILCNFWPILKKSSFIKPLIIHIWFGESPGGLISSLFKLGCCDLYLRFQLTLFVKHIFELFLPRLPGCCMHVSIII